MTLLEPRVMMRPRAGGVAMILFAYGAVVSARILRYAHLGAVTEGQLLLERQSELAATLVRVGAFVQLFSCAISILAADRLSGAIRGAMCGYGVVLQNRWGWASIGVSLATSLAAGVLLQILALDRRVRGLDLMRPLALACLALAPLAALDWTLAMAWLTKLDLTVVASCCSTTLDSARREGTSYWQGPRLLATWGAALGVPAAIASAVWAFRHPVRPYVLLAAATTLAALPLALGAAVLEVAPHVYEVPQHLCPFCLFKADAYFIGYPLFGSIFLAATWSLGAQVGSLLAGRPHVRDAFPSFAKTRMARQAVAWAVALVLGAAPIVTYSLASPGASLFR
jgi:hypothetical protein